MANQFTDRLGYRHCAHTVVRENVIIHQVWTSTAEGVYLGLRSLTHFPVGHEWVPADVWVFTSDFAVEPMRAVTEPVARRLLAAWCVAGALFTWQEPSITAAVETADFRG